MATERWDDDKLDKLAEGLKETSEGLKETGEQLKQTGERIKEIAAIAENNSQRIKEIAAIAENNSQRIKEIAALTESNARVIQALANTAAEAREEREQTFRTIAQQQTNIDGLRRETIRMLDLLLNQQNQQNNSEE
ncbi:hypothetical protein BCD67_06845 [Oscillatoriales cyanobacterium USR001]|nr:hypothetical protein BCD67_06845 [Oscillatoriales cyanobacterium USR001]